ncbi:MAG: hypothetical protein Q8O05_00820 [Chloroflexota bacterium]|nr:hypothetical protein [Chloroflexota bacterium]
MKRLRVYGAILVVLLSIISTVVGAVFVTQGLSTKQFIVDGLRAEKVTLGIEESAVKAGEIVDTEQEARVAAVTLTQHLRDRYGTYADTKQGSPERTTYVQGLTLLNSLNEVVMGFGTVTMVIVSGVLLITMGLATGTVGVAMVGLARRVT